MTPEQFLVFALRSKSLQGNSLNGPNPRVGVEWIESKNEYQRAVILFRYGTRREKFKAAVVLRNVHREKFGSYGLDDKRLLMAFVSPSVRATMFNTGLTLYKSWRLKSQLHDLLLPVRATLLADLAAKIKHDAGIDLNARTI